MVRTRRRKRSGGFTLIELLVSMALSTVGLLGLLALQMIAVRGNMMSRNFGEAIGIAQQTLENAVRTPYANLAGLADPACSVTLPYGPATGGAYPVSPTQDTSSTQAIYRRCTAVTVNGVANTTNVKVTVWWFDTQSSSSGPALHSVVLETERSP